jgi:hypothetical protein
MLEGDVEAVLVFLRNTGFGPEINLNLIDPLTKSPFQTTVILDTLNIKNGQTPNEDGTFTITLPKSQTTVKLKPLTYGEILEISRLEETYPKGRVVPKVTWRLQKEIVEINGNTDKSEIAKFVEQMPISDSKFIRRFILDNEPRLDLSKEVIAPSGEKVVIDITFGVEFFRPFLSI